MARRFTSQIDAWLVALLVTAGLLPLGLVFAQGAPTGVPLAILTAAGVLVIWTFVSTRYDVTEETLRIRSGPFSWRIPLASIRSLRATRNALSSPALSLDRIEVRHARGSILISPRDKAGFVEAILAAAPGVLVENLPHANVALVPGAPALPSARAPLLAAAVLGTAVLLFVGAILYLGTRPPVVAVSADTLTIRGGMTSRSATRTEIVGVALRDTLPAARKRTGFNAGRYLRGVFDVDAIGRADLFVVRGVPPYLFIQTTTTPIVINFDDADETRALEQRLRLEWQLR